MQGKRATLDAAGTDRDVTAVSDDDAVGETPVYLVADIVPDAAGGSTPVSAALSHEAWR
jgi:hypothetical protein